MDKNLAVISNLVLNSFSSVEELEPILAKGLKVVFSDCLWAQGCLLERRGGRWQIVVGSGSWTFASMRLQALEPAITILHEILHILNPRDKIRTIDDGRFGKLYTIENFWCQYFGNRLESEAWEREITYEASRILRTHPALSPELLCELSARENCGFEYRFRYQTARPLLFMQWHFDCIRDSLQLRFPFAPPQKKQYDYPDNFGIKFA